MLLLFPADANAVNYFSASGGTWNGANRWNVGGPCGGVGNSGAAYPGSAAGDTATICNNHAVTLPLSPANAITSLTIGSTCVNATSLASSTGAVALTVNGNVSLACANSTLSFNGQSGVFTLTVNGNIINSGTVSVSNNNRVHVLDVSGDITNDGTIDLFISATRNCNLTFTGGATHTLSGSGGTTQFNNVTVNDNLIVSMDASGTTVTQTGTFNVSGTLDLQGGTYNIQNTIAVDGATMIEGSAAVMATLGITSTNGTKTYTGLVTVNAYGTWTNGTNEAFEFVAGLTINNDGGGNDGTFNTTGSGAFTFSGGGIANNGSFTSSGTSGFTFTTAAQDITCSDTHPISIATITVTAVTVTNKCTASPSSLAALTVRTALSGTGDLTQDTNASLFIGDNSGITTLTADATGNTVTYDRAAAQAIKLPAGGNYWNLTLSGSGNKTSVSGTYNILGDMTVNSGPTWLGTSGAPDPAVNITGNLKNDGIFTGGNSAYTLKGDLENNGTFTHTAGTSSVFTLTGTVAQAIKGTTAASFRNLTDANTSATVTANTNFNITATLTVNAGAVLAPDAAVQINSAGAAGAITGSGTIHVTRVAATADYSNQYEFTTNTLSGLTVNYSGAGAQTINVIAGGYGSLFASNSGTKTLGGNVTVNASGNLNVNTSTVVLDMSTFTVNCAGSGTLTVVDGATLMIGGTNGFPAGYSTVSLDATSTVEYAGTTQDVGAETYGHLTISGSGTKTMSGGNVTVNGTLTLNNGLVDTGSNLLTIGSAGSVSRCASGTNCFVVGNLVKNVATGGPTVTWEVGTENASPAYAPVSIVFTGAVAGNFQVSTPTTAGDHADTTANLSGIDPSLSVNRFWTFTRLTGSATSYAPTFDYGNIAGDVDFAATPANFIIGQKSGGAWEYPTLSGTPTGTGATATGVIDASGDDFVIGESLLSTAPFSQWRMNQFAWNGTADEVVDAGSGGFHGTAESLSATKPTTDAATPAIAGSPGTCQYGVFNRANKDYVALPSGYPNLSGADGGFTITAWIRSTNVGDAGQRIMVDDEGNANGNWSFSLGDPGSGRLRFIYRQAATFILDTPGGSPLVNDTWYFVAVSVRLKASGNGSLAEIFVYDTSGTLFTSARSSFATTSFGADSTPPSIGGETNASGEGTSSYGFGGNIDMVSVYQSNLSAQHINLIRQITHNCVFPDHIRIEHDGLGLTCAPESVIVKACTDASCSVTYTGSVTTTLSPTGWVGGDTIIFSGGSTTAQLRHTTAGVITLGAGSTSPPPTNPTRCFNGATETCSMEFKDSGFIFDVPTLTAGKQSAAVTISAVRTDLTSQTCAPAFTGARDVNFWSTYSNPASGTLQAIVNSTTIATSSPGTTVSLTFDASAQSTFTVTYPDAGQMQLDARYDGSAGNNDTGLVMTGNDQFVSVPAGLCVESTDTDSDCASGDATCSPFVAAGASFNLKVRAVGWENNGEINEQFCSGNAITPNFRLSSIPLTSTLVAPAGGTNAALGVSSVDIVAADSGSHTASNEAVSEVGVFKVTATPPAYFGQTIAASTSANIGRFIPDRFTVTDNSPGFANACTGGGTPFTYRGQEFYYGTVPVLTVTAVNTAGAVTQNYGDSTGGPERFWKLSSTLSRSYSDQSGHAAVFSSSDLAGVTLSGDTDFTDGAGTLTLGNSLGDRDIFIYDRPDLTSAEAPFAASVNLTFLAAGLTDTDGVCYDRDDNGTCDTYTHLSQGGAEPGSASITGTSQRFGRLAIGTGAGSELLPIALPVQTEYYDGAAFIVNTDDVCTAIAATDLRLTSSVEGPETDGDIDISNGPDCAAGLTTVTVANTPFANGQAGVSFSAPGESCTGFAEVTIDLSAVSLTIGAETYPDLEFLRYDWLNADSGEDGPYTADPNGRVDFGIHEGPRALIYTRDPR